MLTNRQRGFQNSSVIYTGFSGFHKMTATVLDHSSKKQNPKL